MKYTSTGRASWASPIFVASKAFSCWVLYVLLHSLPLWLTTEYCFEHHGLIWNGTVAHSRNSWKYCPHVGSRHPSCTPLVASTADLVSGIGQSTLIQTGCDKHINMSHVCQMCSRYIIAQMFCQMCSRYIIANLSHTTLEYYRAAAGRAATPDQTAASRQVLTQTFCQMCSRYITANLSHTTLKY
jgi:hypothetical protein